MQRQYFDAANVIHQQEQQAVSYPQEQTKTTTNIIQMPDPKVAVAEQVTGVSITPHEMPAPTHEPWNINLMPWKLDASSVISADGVMKFSANRNFEVEALQRRLQLHHKRKSDIMPEHPPKQFISEEKFTAHFNGLHISSDYVQHNNNPMSTFSDIDNIDDQPSTSGVCFTNRSYEDYQITAKELEEKLLRANRITICDEVRRMHNEQKKISILPEALMNRMEKPCKALVLWQPSPIDILRKVNVPNIMDDTSRLVVYNDVTNNTNSNRRRCNDDINITDANGGDDYDEFSDDEPDVEIDDYIDNNNTSSLDFNNLKSDGMEEDL